MLKTKLLPACLILLVHSLAASPCLAGTYVAQTAEIKSETEEKRVNIAKGAGFGVVFTIVDRPEPSLDGAHLDFLKDQNAHTMGERYCRVLMDFRRYSFQIQSGGGTGFAFYQPLPANSDPQSNVLSKPEDGWTPEISERTALKIVSNPTQTPDDSGFRPGPGINWVLLLPDTASTAAPIQVGNIDSRAIAVGFTWTDANSDGLLNGGDIVTCSWAVTADDFEEMNTVAKLNAIVAREG